MISDLQSLERLCGRIASSPFVALDTEADSLHAYPEKICLIQVAIEGEEVLVDPLASLDLTPLWRALRGRTVILHGADYDLRMLHRCAGFVPSATLDTMIAARLLGRKEFGLVSLADQMLGVKLEKGSQKANWAIRPLTEKMAQYALNDVRFLRPLSALLEAELARLNRLAWLEESCHRLIQTCTAPVEEDPNEVWRVKGCHRLSRRGMSVLRSIWHWRESEARNGNRPPFFILGHEDMIGIAGAATSPEADVSFAARLPQRWSGGKRSRCIAAIEAGLAEPPERWPDYPIKSILRWTDAEKVRFEKIQHIRDAAARDLELDPTLIASRAVLVQLATHWETAAASLMKWQLRLLESASPLGGEVTSRTRRRSPSNTPSPERPAKSDDRPAG